MNTKVHSVLVRQCYPLPIMPRSNIAFLTAVAMNSLYTRPIVAYLPSYSCSSSFSSFSSFSSLDLRLFTQYMESYSVHKYTPKAMYV